MAYNIEKQQARRQSFIQQLGGKCVDCGSKERLEFDHIDPKTKLFQISSSNLERRLEIIEKEVAKCQLLCRSCHMKKTWKNDRAIATHGTLAYYTHHKCRCMACRLANTISRRNYRGRKKMLLVA